MRLLGVLALLAALSQPAVGASAKQPTVHHTYFKESVSKLVYFKSRTSMLAIDRANGVLHRSSDSGATWGSVDSVPPGQVSRLYVHPYEPQVAYALSEDTQHWVTRDEGATWAAFSTELPPTTSGERPLAFHAERTGWIMYTGERCVEEKSGWWPFPRLVCHDEPAYVRDGFAQAVKDHRAGDRSGSGVTPLLPGRDRAVVKCLWARQTKEFEAMAEEAIFCLEIVEKTAEAGKTRRAMREHVMANATAAMQATTTAAKLHRRVLVEGSNGAGVAGGGDDGGDGVSVRAETGERKRGLADDLAALLDGQLVRRALELVVSEDFFSTQRTVRFGAGNDGMGGDRAGGGVVAISVLRKYLLAAISHAHSDEMDLFVSMDGHTWAESHLPLPAGGEEDAYTILESSAHAVFVDVVTAASDAAVGSLFRSNSNGTYYTQALAHTHRSASGLVDVARVHGIEGVVVANQVSNWGRISHGIERILRREQFELRSRISFNDGARWRFLRAPAADIDGKAYGCSDDAWQTGECALHVHLMTSPRMRGHVLGGAAAAGVVLAVGSVGPRLLPWAECDTFLSRDGGLAWQMAARGAHHVHVADSGAVLVLAADAGEATDVVRYSLDAGGTWLQARLDAKVRVSALFGDDEGLGAVVLAAGVAHGAAHDGEQALVAVDFGAVWPRQCAVDASDPRAGSDAEAFVLAAHEDNDCVLGHRAEHVRRRPGAQCAMRLAQVLAPRLADCACTAHDFECDYNYAPAGGGRCELAGSEVVPHGECLRAGDRFLASSGYRLIPGDTCVRSDGAGGDGALDRPVEKPCPRVQAPGGGGSHGDDDASDLGKVTHHTMVVRGDPHVLAFANSTSYLMMTTAQELFRSHDEGAQWQPVDLAAATATRGVGLPVYLAANPHHPARAYVYTDAGQLAYTADRGASWHVMKSLPAPANGLHVRPLLDFSAASADQLVWVGGTACPGCHTEIWTTADHGARWTRLTTHATKCLFAPRALAATLGGPAVVCSRYRRTGGGGDEQDRQMAREAPDAANPVELHVFTRPFDDAAAAHVLALPAAGALVNFFVQGRFVVAAAAEGAALTLLVSDDGRALHAARFPPGTQIAAEGFTVLPGGGAGGGSDGSDGSDDALLVDVEGASSAGGGGSGWGRGWGTLFASNSNGTHFHRVLQHTNRNRLGAVDVERVAGVRGALLANRVANAEALGRGGAHVHKQLRTAASWDGGRTWQALAPPTHDASGAPVDCAGCSLHLFGRAALAGGALYGARAAPGVLVGVGTVGAHLGRFDEARTYLSRDGGRSWAEARGAPAMHAFADHGGVLALAADGAPTDSLAFSADGGRTWQAHRIVEAGARVVVEQLLGAGGGDGGGPGVLLLARAVGADGVDGDATVVVAVDFSRLFARRCAVDERDHARSDFELWTPRHGVDAGGRRAPVCSLGRETAYWRRKPQAACFVGDEFAPPRTAERTCACSLADYECAEGFWRDDYGRCALDGPDPDAPRGCRAGTTYRGRSGYRRIARSQCAADPAQPDWAQPVDRVCGLAGGVHAAAHVLDAAVADVQYFGASRHVLVRTGAGGVLASFDEGATWAPLRAGGGGGGAEAEALPPVASVVRQPYFDAHAYLVPARGSLAFYTDDEARTLRRLQLPTAPAHASLGAALRFHPDNPDWLIFLGQPNEACRGRVDARDCQVEAFVSRDHGAHWHVLAAPLGPAGCVFLKTDRPTPVDARAVACLRHAEAPGDGGSVAVSTAWFAAGAPAHVLARNATDFTLAGGFLLVAQAADGGRALRMLVSLDGRAAAAARFPGNLATVDAAYTVLEPPEGFAYQDSRGRSRQMPGGGVMLHVTTSSAPGAEWGSLYASNSNGTYYARALAHVNRDDAGLVDFERLRGLEGAALANVVANAGDVARAGAAKRLQTVVTADGGARWHFLRVAGDRLPCHVTAPASGACALHLHGYTEVSDPENIYSAAGAPGLAMGVGTVGGALGRLGVSDTFLSADGGAEWRMVRRGAMWHAFGDHGALIVVADRLRPVASVEYSLDQGRSWLTLPLPADARAMRVDRLATTPDATSRRFLLLGHRDAAADHGILVSLDFTGAQPRACVSPPSSGSAKPAESDFELFTPAPIADDGCLLGRRVHYYRRKPAAMCFVGDEFQPTRYLADTCECTARDYECNHNFVRDPTGARCVLIEGMQAPRTNCTAGQRDYFTIESAYRRIPQSICHGGLVLDRPKEVWCPGKASAMALLWSLFLAVFFLSLAYVAYHVWRARFPYLRLEDVGSAVAAPALRHLQAADESRVAQRLAPVFFGALATGRAVGRAARDAVLWSVDRAAPYLPYAVQRWSYEHPPRWGGQLTMDGRDRRAVRADGGSRFRYQRVANGEAAARVFGDGLDGYDEYDEVEAGFNHFLDEEAFAGRDLAEDDAPVVDRQVLFANTELSDDEEDENRQVEAALSSSDSV
ncbi:vacuolar protein sorting/targeting protein PEP1 [Coemansia erecta]|uniref:Vacuolar protein sorting/targeting protein PEP1 n=1 Tax=Coemansia erecta TaxID=147472 RepID=A0A9W7Y485_9FUNG|nr:vacuolar protein sorting/targeting protein PEP1 [Coemansia erecta]